MKSFRVLVVSLLVVLVGLVFAGGVARADTSGQMLTCDPEFADGVQGNDCYSATANWRAGQFGGLLTAHYDSTSTDGSSIFNDEFVVWNPVNTNDKAKFIGKIYISSINAAGKIKPKIRFLNSQHQIINEVALNELQGVTQHTWVDWSDTKRPPTGTVYMQVGMNVQGPADVDTDTWRLVVVYNP